jgi:broad specificity phosphatase PhoE
MTVVHLMRHGEVYNPDKVLYGRLPGFRLSDLGVQQAELATTFFTGRPIVHLVASPLDRAQQTAAPIAAATGLSVHSDERLIEAANELQGRRVAGGKGLFTDVSNYRYFYNPLKPSWGEPYVQIAARMMAALHAARDAAEAAGAATGVAGGEAVCVSHQLPIVAVRRLAEGKRLFHDPRRRQCALASVTSFTFAGDTIVDVNYSEPAAALGPGHGAGA